MTLESLIPKVWTDAILKRLELPAWMAEYFRQANLTASLGQVTCGGEDVHADLDGACPRCGARV